MVKLLNRVKVDYDKGEGLRVYLWGVLCVCVLILTGGYFSPHWFTERKGGKVTEKDKH